MAYTYAIGRRKRSVAKCKLYPEEKGELEINGKKLREYFSDLYAKKIEEAIQFMNLGEYKIQLFAKGGGITGQADSCCLALARVKLFLDPDSRYNLKQLNYFTRDSRIKEPKKFGLRKARKAPQWVKR